VRRQQLGRPACNPVWKAWTEKDKALLGKFPDTEVAKRTGHPVNSVRNTRWSLSIGYEKPAHRSWTKEEDALLGTLSDREVARKIGRTFGAVRVRRVEFGLKDPSVRPRWSPAEDRLLGTAPDAEVAGLLRRTLSAVKTRRKDLKIAAYRT
jgi:hypothetical protein